MKIRDVIDTEKLLDLVDTKGLSQSDAAKKLGVSRQAVSKHLRGLRSKTTKAVVLRKVDRVVERKLDTVQQLTKINEDANELLELCMRWQRGDEEALQILENQIKTVRVGNTEEMVREYKFKDPRELALKAMAEIRSQLRLQLDIYQTLFDTQAAQEFQQIVLETIAEVNPDARDAIIRKLNEKRVVRSAIRFS